MSSVLKRWIQKRGGKGWRNKRKWLMAATSFRRGEERWGNREESTPSFILKEGERRWWGRFLAKLTTLMGCCFFFFFFGSEGGKIMAMSSGKVKWRREGVCGHRFNTGSQPSATTLSSHLPNSLLPMDCSNHQASNIIPNSQNLLKLIHWVGDPHQLSHPL